ncbi:lipopolysaccharide biosynthesis protein [bacterium]|nr:lipopolysaccharide biosynthesis protein [bacterium]MBU1873952.1 lipopolysaccharide biosynthesis protein [bacterium]
MDHNKNLKKQIVNSSFWVFGASLFSRSISFLSTLILARLLTPESFGVIGYGFLIVSAIGLIREMGFNSALIFQKERIEEAASTALVFIFLWSTFLYILVVIFAPFAATFFREPRLVILLRVLTISLILNSLANVPLTLLEKDIRFARRVVPEVVNLTVYGILTALFAYLGFNYWSFVIGILCADICQLIVAFILRPIRIRLKPDITLLKQMFGFGKNVMGLGILNFGIRNIDDFFVGRMLGTVTLGIYNFSYRIANIPATNITNVLGKVLFPGFAKIADDTIRLKEAFLRTFEYLSYITIPVTAYIILLTPDVIHLFLPKWIDAILPIQLIAYFGGVRSISSGSGSVFLAKGRPDLLLPISLTQVVFLSVFLYPTVHYFGLNGVCILVNMAITIALIWGFLKLKKLIDISLNVVMKIAAFPFFISIITFFFLIFIADFFDFGKIISVSFKGFAFPSIYFILTWYLSNIPQSMYEYLIKKD